MHLLASSHITNTLENGAERNRRRMGQRSQSGKFRSEKQATYTWLTALDIRTTRTRIVLGVLCGLAILKMLWWGVDISLSLRELSALLVLVTASAILLNKQPEAPALYRSGYGIVVHSADATEALVTSEKYWQKFVSSRS
jgi:hypothetical protein